MNNVVVGYGLVGAVCAYSSFLVGMNVRGIWRGVRRGRGHGLLGAIMLAAMMLAPAARAHFVFVVPDEGGATGRVIMSEGLAPDDGVEIKIIAGAKLTVRDGAGQETPLAMQAAKDAYAVAIPAGTRLVYGVADLGWSQRGGAKPHVLVYHPKTIVGDAFAAGNAVGEAAPVEIVPVGKVGAVRFEVRVAGKAVGAGVEVVVIRPDGKETRVKTAADGATPAFDAPGRYGAWARSFVDQAGERDGKKYEQVRRYATLVVDVGGAKVAAGARPQALSANVKVTTLEALPEATSSFGAVASEGYLYVYGGHIAPTHNYSTEAVSGKFFRRKIDGAAAAPVWEALAGGPAMQGMNLAAHGGKVYRVGGMVPKNAPGTKADNWSTAEAWCFDPAAGKWERLPDMPEPRSSHDVAVIGDKLYVVGGWNMKGAAGGNDWLGYGLVMDLSVKAPKWEKIAQPFERRALIAAVHEGKLWVIGGFDDQSDPSLRTEVYDPATGKWSNGPELPGKERNGFSPAACSTRGNLYVSVADGSLLRLAGGTWAAVGRTTPRIVHRMVGAGGGVWVLGGADRGGNLALVEAVELR